MGFIDLKKAYERVNRKALWQVLRMYGVGGKLLSKIKSMYANRLARVVNVKWGENECFRIESGLRQGCAMFPWLQSAYECSDGRGESG